MSKRTLSPLEEARMANPCPFTEEGRQCHRVAGHKSDHLIVTGSPAEKNLRRRYIRVKDGGRRA